MKRVFESHIHFPIDMYEAEFTEKIDDETLRLTELMIKLMDLLRKRLSN